MDKQHVANKHRTKFVLLNLFQFNIFIIYPDVSIIVLKWFLVQYVECFYVESIPITFESIMEMIDNNQLSIENFQTIIMF